MLLVCSGKKPTNVAMKLMDGQKNQSTPKLPCLMIVYVTHSLSLIQMFHARKAKY